MISFLFITYIIRKLLWEVEKSYQIRVLRSDSLSLNANKAL